MPIDNFFIINLPYRFKNNNDARILSGHKDVGSVRTFISFLITLGFVFSTVYRLKAQEIPVLRSVEKAIHLNSRSKTGKPGKNYWQNKGDYNMAITFDPATRELQGKMDIIYTNNSPDTLKTLLFKLYPNFYKTDAVRNMPIAEQDLGKGVNIKGITIDGKEIASSDQKIRGTNMYLSGVKIDPGKDIHVRIEYDYQLNKGSFVRTGQVDPGSFFIAYFFPRIAVYDDIDGWNQYPYAGKEEFYNDFGNFHVAITVPGNYQVWGTGELKNTNEVFQNHISDRIKRAEQSDEMVNIITPPDIKEGNITLRKKMNIWKFDAVNVTDFAFALSDHYVWQSRSVMVDSVSRRRVRVDAVYNPEHQVYDNVAGYTAKTVELISYYFPKIPFPYSHQTVFDGLDAMEYPMMVNNLPFKEHNDRLQLTVHEVFHSIFPFYVGTNETKYSFMDEGWATFSEFFLSPKVDDSVPLNYDVSEANNNLGLAEDVPIMTPTPQLYGKSRFTDKDLKPALAHLYLRELLGNELFLKAVQNYIKDWAGKHPTPYDFFNSIEHTSGMNLNWFWKNWYFEKNVPDLAIAKVARTKAGYHIKISSPGTLAVPIHLIVVYKDGSKITIVRKISCWENGNKEVDIFLKNSKQISQLHLGDSFDIDINASNNQWNADQSKIIK